MATDVLEAPPVNDGKIICHIDNARVHSVALHIKKHYPNSWTLERYRKEFPDAEILSDFAKKKMAEVQARKEEEARAEQEETSQSLATSLRVVPRLFADVFGIDPANKATLNPRGKPIQIATFDGLDPDSAALVPDIDHKYVFPIENTKHVMTGLELPEFPIYAWGLHGSGKTTLFEQFCARTGRPFMRVQHTVNTEESHILGQWVVRDGDTQFQLGPLPMAMINGWTYCADEYDFAMPSVLSVYQPVLEGKALVIKEAPPHLRVIRPNKHFRFVATGNTNGGGDETGLYQGTQIQNAANYSRFRIVIEVQYMDAAIETAILVSKVGVIQKEAEKMVNFAKEVRDAFRAGRLSATMSPREVIGAATIAMIRGGNFRLGIEVGFTNRLSRSDREAVNQFAQRIFGNA